MFNWVYIYFTHHMYFINSLPLRYCISKLSAINFTPPNRSNLAIAIYVWSYMCGVCHHVDFWARYIYIYLYIFTWKFRRVSRTLNTLITFNGSLLTPHLTKHLNHTPTCGSLYLYTKVCFVYTKPINAINIQSK